MLSLKKVSEADTDLIFRWQQSVITRQFAFNPRPPSYVQHQAWMQAQLSDPNIFFYLAESDHQPCGCVRFNKDNLHEAVISIFLNPLMHGKGLGGPILKLAIDKYATTNQDISTLVASVLNDNVASHKLFTRVGFKQFSATDNAVIYHFDLTFVKGIL